MTVASRSEIAELFRSGSPEAVSTFIRACPEFPFQSQAAGLASAEMPAARSLALSMLSLGLTSGRAATLGAEVALAANDLLREDFERLGPMVVLPLTLSRTAFEAINALNLSGRYREALTFAEEVIRAYGDEPENGPSIRVARISALHALGRIDEARRLIEVELRSDPRGPARIELERLWENVKVQTGDARELKKNKPATEASEDLAEENEQLRKAADAMLAVIAGPGHEMNELEVMRLIRDGTAIFTHPSKGRDPELIRRALTTLTAARDWARSAQSSQENDALWGIYLCQSRLDKPAAAAEALKALRANIEKARALVASPFERGGIASQYPWLFSALCTMLVQSDQALDLLDAMEGAKGRAVADLLVRRTKVPVDERTLSECAARVPGLMSDVEAHYVSYFVDTDATYAVLVAKDGSVHQAGSIPLTQEAIRTAAQRVDPRTWGAKSAATDRLLEPLLSWLEPHWHSGLLRAGDHVCYSPDEHLHHVPLHVVRFKGAPLANTFSVSRTHGALALTLLLDRPATRPTAYLAIEVPTTQNARKPEFLDALARVRIWLETNLTGRSLRNESARPEALQKQPLTHRLVHFATHGRFPVPGTRVSQNPYEGSGLLLAARDGLPDGERVARGELEEAMLTPKRILDMGLDFTGSHVTLQACVSGLAAEGLGGDALGLDWALTQAGAGSLLTSHWNVGAKTSATFVERFYEHWLKKGLSRAAAWQTTISDCQREGGELAAPASWAAFSLSGDWR